MATSKKNPVTKNSTLLKISTIVPDAQYVDIDGAKYELIPQQQMGTKEQLRIGRLASSVQDIRDIEDITDELIDKLLDMSREIVRTVMPTLPEEVLAKLNDYDMQSIMLVFTQLSGLTIPKAEALPSER